jgi:hypothetical protein
MATLLLSAAGTALGGALGSVGGLGAMALGKAAGALAGAAIDQRLLGAGSAPVETGRVERFRVMGSSEGSALPRVFGRCRVAGQVIWSSRFLESVRTENVGGKGGGTSVREYSYSVSLALALCEGRVARIGRIWADGQAIDQSGLTLRLHEGSDDQLADPLIAAIEGEAPAFRGTAYLVFESLDLTPFGNRIPQFNVEVFRRVEALGDRPRPPALDVRGVALVPGTGEYALATEPVRFLRGSGESAITNVHNDRGLPDLVASLDQLAAELPNVESVSLVATWFGDDLRCDRCRLWPAVEQTIEDADNMPWTVSGTARKSARLVSRVDGRPVFGGTPADVSVVQAIRRLRDDGRAVMFYPFILMDIQAANGQTDPWTGAANQPPVPWRGRITLAAAPGRDGSTDKTAAAADEVAAFFGTASAGDFVAAGNAVSYVGPAEWSYRRFVLHYAHLCALAGGVDAFCVGSELRGLTHIRDSAAGYPAVRALIELAEDVRAILPEAKIGYAADWSEYFGHQPGDGSGDVIFHLDPLWASPAIDFIGIDNYMPLSDWRDGTGHADVAAGSIYDLGYLKGNVAGGEGFDWYYADAAAREAQVRTPIVDGAYGEHWVFRYKDLASWWTHPHFDRIGGVRAGAPTAWAPRSKPIWFTELGCGAVDKGTNQPNVFYDPKSSESFFPYFSSGARDELIQYRYLQASFAHWTNPENNPPSDVYEGRMVDMARAHVWAWDARPWPDFPDREDVWSDGENHARGHWLNGRATIASLGDVVVQIAERCGFGSMDVEHLHGAVTGYQIEGVESGRQSLQPLMLAYAFDSVAVGETLAFANRGGSSAEAVSREDCVAVSGEPVLSLTRLPAAETADRVQVGFVRADSDYAAGAVYAVAPETVEPTTDQMSFALVLSEAEAGRIAERSLTEGRIAQDQLSLSLPLSRLGLTPGDLIEVEGRDVYRVDRIEETGHRAITAVRAEPSLYASAARDERRRAGGTIDAPGPVTTVFLDLPLLSGNEDAGAPHIAASARPWTGPVAVYTSSNDFGYRFERELRRPATTGRLLEPLPAGRPGLWMRGEALVQVAGSLQSRGEDEVLAGANVAALRLPGGGDWEVFQFTTAVLVGANEYRLGGLLRGQAGTDVVMPALWPAGSEFVLIDGAVQQLDLPSAARGLTRHYRIGPSRKAYDDASYIHRTETFDGVGLRPYSPAHLTVGRRGDGAVVAGWIRRTRIDGDSWLGFDVPLGEEREAYFVRVVQGDVVLRTREVTAPSFTYLAAEQVEDGASGTLMLEVAQISARFGPGLFERIAFDV